MTSTWSMKVLVFMSFKKTDVRHQAGRPPLSASVTPEDYFFTSLRTALCEQKVRSV